jgi:thymidylate kinase
VTSPSELPRPLELIDQLAAALARDGVVYCHWKSNEAMDRTLTGRNDLDLLVARADAERFRACVARFGFHAASHAADRAVPALEDFYGYDGPTGRLIHVQAHYQLVLGDDMTKNYRVPIEASYLDGLDRTGVLPVPRAELEFVVLVLRLVLKHCPWDAIAARKGRLTDSERRELAWLGARCSAAERDAVRRRHLPFVDDALFAACLAGLAPGASVRERVRAGRRLQAALEGLGRRPHRADLVLKAWRRVRRRLPFASSPVRHLDAGGLVVAVVGGDGSGKSSAVGAIVESLANAVRTEAHHLGKPPASLSSRVVRRLLHPLRDRGWLDTTRMPAWTEFAEFPGYVYMLWHLLTARDRRSEYRRVRRQAVAGVVAVCDRWPAAGLTTMDGPRLGTLPGLERRRLARRLAAAEARCYSEMLPPDLLVVMRVDPQVAVQRRPEQDAEFVHRRAQEVHERVWYGPGVTVIDANRPLEEVRAAVLEAVWQRL